MKTYKYIVNEEKGVVVCILTVTKKDEYGEDIRIYRGIAKCCPDDAFDKEAGMRLAKRRAILKEEKEELSRLDWKWMDSEIERYTRELKKVACRKKFLRNNISRLKKEIGKIVRPE